MTKKTKKTYLFFIISLFMLSVLFCGTGKDNPADNNSTEKDIPVKIEPEKRKTQEDYDSFKKEIFSKFESVSAGKFYLPMTRLKTGGSDIALTFDACGGPTGSGYNKKLIDYLVSERIPSTLFINARWIDSNPGIFKELSSNPLFEIENHGTLHKPCSVVGNAAYNIKGTKNPSEVIDEVELNSRKIEAITGRKPKFYRSGTAWYDSGGIKIVRAMGYDIVNFSVNSYDFEKKSPASLIAGKISKARGGDIVIMHMNHPDWNTCEGLMEAVPLLRKNGFRFVKLEDVGVINP